MLKNKEIRKQASQMAFESGNLLKLCLGVCICTASVIIPLMITSLLSIFLLTGTEELSPTIYDALYAVGFLLVAVLSVPVIGGFFGLSYNLYKGKKTHLAQIFLPFTSAKIYFKVVLVGIPMLLRWVAVASIPMVAFSMFSETTVSEYWLVNFSVYFVAMTVSVIFAGLLAFFTSHMFFVPYFICNGCEISEAFVRSRIAMRGRKLKLAGYIFGFTGIFLLSLLTIGSLFVIYTIPMMVLAYFIYAEQSTLNITDNTEERI